MAERGHVRSVHDTGECPDLFSVFCELWPCLELLGEPARIRTTEPPRKCFGHQLCLIKRGSALS